MASAAAALRRAGSHAGEEVRSSLTQRAHRMPLLTPARQVFLALGSNVGDRAELLRAAVRALPAAGVTVHALSSLYETAPAYVTDQVRAAEQPCRKWLQLLTSCRRSRSS